MRNRILIAIVLIPVIVFSQDRGSKKTVKKVKTDIPIQAQYSKDFGIKTVNFNKRIDLGGRGEVLEVEFVVRNLTDEPMDLYIFTIATYEKTQQRQTSFDLPIPLKERVRSFVPFPFDLKNFEYTDYDEKGQIKKDRKGQDKKKFIKFPHNPRAGIEPQSGKMYNLKNQLIVRTTHLSRYRTNYFYFNEVAILVFDSEAKPVFRQLYKLKGWRR